MTIAVAVQHHPTRAHLLPELLRALQPLHDINVNTDEHDDRDTWRAHRNCLGAKPDNATHLLVIQDDAIPASDFAARVTEVTDEKANAIVCLFVPGMPFLIRRMLEARDRRERYIALPPAAFVPLVAVIYPAAHVRALLDYAGANGWPSSRRPGRADDAVVARYAAANRITIQATVPSLADHRSTIPSIARPSHRDGRHRRAALFAGAAMQDPP